MINEKENQGAAAPHTASTPWRAEGHFVVSAGGDGMRAWSPADAKLIAAAPDLLAKAKALIILLAPDLSLLTETTRNAVSSLCGVIEAAAPAAPKEPQP